MSGSVLSIILLGVSSSQALDLSSHSLVYQEDFEGEIGFPTTPEVNLLSIGANSSVGVDGLNNPFSPPFISGGVVVGSIHSEVPTAGQNVHVPATFSNSFGMRATFHGFSLGVPPADGQGSAGVVAAFGPLLTPTSVVEASLGISRSFGSATGFAVVRYLEPPAAPVTTFVAISASAVSAVLSGASFTVDLAFDKSTMIATGSVDVAGVGVFTPSPADASGIAGITSSTPLSATNLFLSEDLGLDVDVNMEDISVFLLSTLVGDQVLIEQNVTSSGTLRSDLVTVVQGSAEVSCPGAFDLCGANIPGLTQGNFDLESSSLTLNVGLAGGTSNFSTQPFNGYIFSDLDPGLPITAISLMTDIPGLTAANVGFTADSVSVNLSGLTVDPGQFFTVELNPAPTPPMVPALSDLGIVALVGAMLMATSRSARQRTGSVVFPVLTIRTNG
jgi:hypothetical protein